MIFLNVFKSAIQVCNFYKLINQFNNEYNSSLNSIENEKNLLIKNSLEIFEFISKNQNNSIKNLEKIIEELSKQQDQIIIKTKAEKIIENRELEKQICELEAKIKGEYIFC